ncbi:MAG TPA: hypothetical protein DDX54_02770 [Rhodospirillaceae bacterium]|jgi:hypothetical protein|nr:hypothetical protein [Alphaproteobacteria bacterium]HBH26307.1 hypothetical protein [Rhodospirillaceae bacterium]
MIFAAIEAQMRARGRATAGEIAGVVGTQEEVVQAVLLRLARKGRVRTAGAIECGGGSCGDTGVCHACPLAAAAHPRVQVFAWVGG